MPHPREDARPKACLGALPFREGGSFVENSGFLREGEFSTKIRCGPAGPSPILRPDTHHAASAQILRSCKIPPPRAYTPCRHAERAP